MAVVANRRSVMTLFSRPTDIHSHRTRLVLAEKNINIEITSVLGPDLPEDLMDLNPYHTVPTLVDRDLTLYDSRVIIEYLDERFPHPPLMPVDPVTRAQFRLALFRIEMDWYSIAQETGRLILLPAHNSAWRCFGLRWTGIRSLKRLNPALMASWALRLARCCVKVSCRAWSFSAHVRIS